MDLAGVATISIASVALVGVPAGVWLAHERLRRDLRLERAGRLQDGRRYEGEIAKAVENSAALRVRIGNAEPHERAAKFFDARIQAMRECLFEN